MKTQSVVVLLAAAALGGACSLEAAQMAAPANLLQATAFVSYSGIGGGQRGSYAIAEHSGAFTRSESRLVFFDVLDNRSGHTDFTLAGPDIEGQIEVRCTMRERNVTLGDVSFTPKRMAYGCDFSNNGRLLAARFEMQEVREGLPGALMKKERRGEIALDGVTLQIQSVHQLQGSPLQTASPIGYVFRMNGRDVGAVEINGRPRALLPAASDPAVRRAVVAGATALALFWDPADSALDDI